jgi:hypothetical protein
MSLIAQPAPRMITAPMPNRAQKPSNRADGDGAARVALHQQGSNSNQVPIGRSRRISFRYGRTAAGQRSVQPPTGMSLTIGFAVRIGLKYVRFLPSEMDFAMSDALAVTAPRLYVPDPCRTARERLSPLAGALSARRDAAVRGRYGALFNGRDGAWLARIETLSKGKGVAVATALIQPQRAEPDLWLLFAPIKGRARTCWWRRRWNWGFRFCSRC